MKRSQQHSLFEGSGEDTRPLADRMRPTSLDEVVGQSHQIGPGKALRSMIEADRTPSMIALTALSSSLLPSMTREE